MGLKRAKQQTTGGKLTYQSSSKILLQSMIYRLWPEIALYPKKNAPTENSHGIFNETDAHTLYAFMKSSTELYMPLTCLKADLY